MQWAQFIAIWCWGQRLLGRAFRRLLTQALVRRQRRVRFCVFGKLRQRFGVAFPIANIAPLGTVRLAEWPVNAQRRNGTLEAFRGIGDIGFARPVAIRPKDDIEPAQKLRMAGKPF
jgi:hypothetical protein